MLGTPRDGLAMASDFRSALCVSVGGFDELTHTPACLICALRFFIPKDMAISPLLDLIVLKYTFSLMGISAEEVNEHQHVVPDFNLLDCEFVTHTWAYPGCTAFDNLADPPETQPS
jgi:hypothetical protein